MNSSNLATWIWTLIGLCLAIPSGAFAQINSINSVIITPRVFNDFPSATGTYLNNYPSSITIGESGEYGATGFADRDYWAFSNNGGASIYTLAANDYFTVSMTLAVTGETTVDNEAGFIIPDGPTAFIPNGLTAPYGSGNGSFPGGDLQFTADPNSGFLGMWGGTGFWNYGQNYTVGETVTMGMRYFYDTGNSENAIQFWVNTGSGNIYSPVQDWSGNLAGDILGGYYQIQGLNTAPGSSGQAVFGNISITGVPEPSSLALLALGILPVTRLFRRRA